LGHHALDAGPVCIRLISDFRFLVSHLKPATFVVGSSLLAHVVYAVDQSPHDLTQGTEYLHNSQIGTVGLHKSATSRSTVEAHCLFDT